MQVLESFKHADTFAQMPLNDRLVATLYVILLGMGITFIALILIWGLTTLMSKIVAGVDNTQKPVAATAAKSTANAATATAAVEDDTELVAVITAAVAATLGTSSSQFVVTNITRTVDQTPVWGRVGRTDVMQSKI